MAILKLKDISKEYKQNEVLKKVNVDFEFDEPRGKVYSIIGPNGAGKTTLMKIIAGILLPSHGNLSIGESDKEEYIRWAKKNVAYISSGERGFYNRNTVRDNVLYYGLIKGEEKNHILEKMNLYSKMLSMDNLLNIALEEMSTGQVKKSQILAALSSNKKIILLDEPSTGLDIDSVRDLENILKYLTMENNFTFIISSHDINLLTEVTDKAYFVFNGKLHNEVCDSYDAKNIRIIYERLSENKGG